MTKSIFCSLWAEAILFLTHIFYRQETRPPENVITPEQYVCFTPLQSILEEGLHSRQSFLVRLTNQFDAFFNPRNATETKAASKYQMFKANIDSSQQELLSCCFCDHVSPNTSKLWLLLCSLRVRFQLASLPGFHCNTSGRGTLY